MDEQYARWMHWAFNTTQTLNNAPQPVQLCMSLHRLVLAKLLRIVGLCGTYFFCLFYFIQAVALFKVGIKPREGNDPGLFNV